MTEAAQWTTTKETRWNLLFPAGAIVWTAVVVGFLVSFLVGVHLKPADSPISFLWPPNAFLLAVLLLSRLRRWPLLLVTVIPIQLAIHLSNGVPWMMGLLWGCSNTLEALLGAALIRRFSDSRKILSTFNGALIFMIFGVIVAPFVTSFTDAGSVILTGYGRDFWVLWQQRFYSNMASTVVFAPPIIAFVQALLEGALTIRKLMEGLCISALSIAVLFFIFHSRLISHEPLGLFFLLPLLLWSTVSFGSAGASTSLLAISLFTVAETIGGHGPFVGRMRMLQVFFFILTAPFFCLGAVIEERRAMQKRSATNLRLSDLISEIASRFVNLRWNLIDAEIERSLDRVREYLQLDRMSIFERVDEDELRLSFTARAEGVPMPPSVLPIKLIRATGISDATAVVACRGDDTDSAASALLRTMGVRSMVAIPIAGEHQLQGFVTAGCHSKDVERAVDAGGLLKIFGEVIFNGIERKRANQSLVESEQRFRHIADHTPLLVWMSDPEGVYTYINAAWVSFTGLSSLQHDAAGWFRCIHPDDFDRVQTEMERARIHRAPLQIEYRFRRHDGEFREILDTGVPRFSGQGQFLGYVGSAVDVTELKRAEQLSSHFSGQLLRAQETERRRIARELHDDIGQRIALLAIELEKLHQKGGDEGAVAGYLLAETKNISTSLRDLSHDLHSTGVELLPLATALRALCKDFNHSHPELHVTFSEDSVPTTLPYDVKLCFYRIAQEALQNVGKHSRGTAVFLHAGVTDRTLKMTVIDNGMGFDVPKGRTLGLGIRSMRERVRLLGGTFRLESQAGIGTTIEASLLLNEAVFSNVA